MIDGLIPRGVVWLLDWMTIEGRVPMPVWLHFRLVVASNRIAELIPGGLT